MASPRLHMCDNVPQCPIRSSVSPSHQHSVSNKARYNRQTLRRSSRVQSCTVIGRVIPSPTSSQDLDNLDDRNGMPLTLLDLVCGLGASSINILLQSVHVGESPQKICLT